MDAVLENLLVYLHSNILSSLRVSGKRGFYIT